MDDSNVPSLLSMPRTGVQTAGEDVYLRTRELVLSEDNPYYWR